MVEQDLERACALYTLCTTADVRGSDVTLLQEGRNATLYDHLRQAERAPEKRSHLAGSRYGISWKDRASLGRIGCQFEGSGMSWQNKTLAGRNRRALEGSGEHFAVVGARLLRRHLLSALVGLL
jgi:hypothetical protein